MKIRVFIYIVFSLFVYDCKAQKTDTYEKWIDCDSFWIFNMYSSVGIADGDTIISNKSIQLFLPKTIKRCKETAGKVVFLLNGNQWIFVINSHEFNVCYDNSLVDVNNYIDYFQNTFSKKEINNILKKKSSTKNRSHYYIKTPEGIHIMLYNIKNNDLPKLVSMIKNNIIIDNELLIKTYEKK